MGCGLRTDIVKKNTNFYSTSLTPFGAPDYSAHFEIGNGAVRFCVEPVEARFTAFDPQARFRQCASGACAARGGILGGDFPSGTHA